MIVHQFAQEQLLCISCTKMCTQVTVDRLHKIRNLYTDGTYTHKKTLRMRGEVMHKFTTGVFHIQSRSAFGNSGRPTIGSYCNPESAWVNNELWGKKKKEKALLYKWQPPFGSLCTKGDHCYQMIPQKLGPKWTPPDDSMYLSKYLALLRIAGL